MKRMLSEDAVFGMSNIRGMHIVTEPDGLDFSFYFSSKVGVNHGIRVKPIFDSTKMKMGLTGTLELHGDWKFTPGKNDLNVSSKRINKMKNFFRKYKVLFSAVWEDELPEDAVVYYFIGKYSLSDVIQELDCYYEYSDVLDSVTTVPELESAVRNYSIFRMND